MKPFFGIAHWPEEIVPYDLGGRVLDIISIPGHDVNSIAVYDRQTGVLLTGDSLYPGRVYVNGDPNGSRPATRGWSTSPRTTPSPISSVPPSSRPARRSSTTP